MMGIQRKPLIFVLLFLLGCLGAYLVIQATPFGLGLRDDSFRYLSAAENLAEGVGYGRWDANGEFHRLTNFPPLYSIALAFFEKFGIQAYRGARAISIAAFAGLIVLVGSFIYIESSSAIVAVIGASFVSFSSSIITTNVWVLSDPLSNLLLVLALVTAILYLERPRSHWWMLCMILFSALAILTRYSNLAVPATTMVVLLILSKQPIWQRIRKSIVYLLPSVLPIFVFLIGNVRSANSLVNRPTPFLHLPEASVLHQGAFTIASWLLPGLQYEATTPSVGDVLAIIILGIIIIGGISLLLHRPDIDTADSSNRLYLMGIVSWLFVLIYLGTLIVTILLFDRLLPLNDRILSPLYITGMLVLLSNFVSAARKRGRTFSMSLVVIAMILIAVKVKDTTAYVGALREDGLGYASAEWRTSRTIDYLQELPDVPIYSNDIPAAYLLAGRTVHSLPIVMNPASLKGNPDYQVEVAQMRNDLLSRGGYIVLIGSDPLHRIEPDAFSTFTSDLDLEALFPDGAVYHHAGD